MGYRKIKPFLLVSVVFACLCTAAFAATSEMTGAALETELANQQRRLDTMQRDIQRAEQGLREARRKEEQAINDISRLGNQLATTEQEINVTVLRIDQITERMTETTANIQKLETSIEDAKDLLSKRVVAVYKYGGTAEFSLLMSANGTQDALTTSYLLTKIAEQDRSLINNFTAEKEALDRAKAELEKQRKDLDTRNTELDNRRRQIQRTSEERNRLLQEARKDKATFEAEQAELQRASNELRNKVNDLLAQRRRQQQAQGGQTPLYFTGGKFAWPLRGPITSQYGTRVHPVFGTRTTHTGVDIDGNRGDPVRAPADGEILYTGWLRGYGQVVIVDHGGELTTIFAHLSAIDVTEGRRVRTGDLIGKVGSTGITTGPHLHFEVRVNGNHVDPMRYLQ